MTTNLLIYAENEYYNLEYQPFKDVLYNFTKIPDNNLHNIIPRAMYSHYDTYCIIDIDNNIYFVSFKDNNFSVPYKIHSVVGKVTLSKFKILGYSILSLTHNNTVTYTIHILLKNLEDCPSRSYEYIDFRIDGNEANSWYQSKKILNKATNIVLLNSTILSDTSISSLEQPQGVRFSNGAYTCNIRDRQHTQFHVRHDMTMFYDSNNVEIPNINYSISPGTSNYKYSVHIYNDYLSNVANDYIFRIDNNNDCHIIDTDEEPIKVCTLTGDSVVLNAARHNHNHIIIVTDNTIINLNNYTFIQIKLPVKCIQHVAHTKVGNIVWTKQIHCRLPPNYKNLIEAFVMCNRMMGKFRIPQCVLQIIFSIIIN